MSDIDNEIALPDSSICRRFKHPIRVGSYQKDGDLVKIRLKPYQRAKT